MRIPYATYDGKSGKLKLFGDREGNAPDSSLSNLKTYSFNIAKPEEAAEEEETTSESPTPPQNIEAYNSRCTDKVFIGKAFTYTSGNSAEREIAKEEALQYARDHCPDYCKKGRLAAFDYGDPDPPYFRGLQGCYDPRVWEPAGGIDMDTSKDDVTTVSAKEIDSCTELCKQVYPDKADTLFTPLIMNFQRKEDVNGPITFGCLCQFRSCSCCHIPGNENYPYRWVQNEGKCTGDTTNKYGPGHTVDPNLCTDAPYNDGDDGTCALPRPVKPDCLFCCNKGTADAPVYDWMPTSCASDGYTEAASRMDCCETQSSDSVSCTTWKEASGCNVIKDASTYTLKGKVCCRAHGDIYAWLDIDPDQGITCPLPERATDPSLCGPRDESMACCVIKDGDNADFQTMTREECSTKLETETGVMFSSEFCELDITGTCQGDQDLPEVYLTARYADDCRDSSGERKIECYQGGSGVTCGSVESQSLSYKVDPDEKAELHVTAAKKSSNDCQVTLVMSLTETSGGEAPEAGICDGARTFGGHCYKMTDKLEWPAAKSKCESWNAHLVTIDDALENEFIKETFAENLWIGYNDRTQEGRYVWTTDPSFSDLSDVCSDGYFYNGHCYKPTEKLTWAEAKAKCVGWGGYLTTINDDGENNYIKAQFSGDKWIGLTDEGSEGGWTWVEGVSNAFAKWKSGEPNGGTGENCVEVYSNGVWNDEKCTDKHEGICESDGPPNTERLYSNWKNNEPNNWWGNEDCGQIYTSGKWNDNNCDDKYKSLCESEEGGDPGYVQRLFFPNDEVKADPDQYDVTPYAMTIAYLRLLEHRPAAEKGCLGCKVKHTYVSGFSDTNNDGTTTNGMKYEVCISPDPDLTSGCSRAACITQLEDFLGDELISIDPGDADNLRIFKVKSSVLNIGACSRDEELIGEDIDHIDITEYDGDAEQKDIANHLGNVKCEDGEIPAKNNFADYLKEVKKFQVGAHEFYTDLHANLITMLDALEKQCDSCNTALTDFLGTGYTASTGTGQQQIPTGVNVKIDDVEIEFIFGTPIDLDDLPDKDSEDNDFHCKTALKNKGYQNIVFYKIKNTNDVKGYVNKSTSTAVHIDLAPGGSQSNIATTSCEFKRDSFAWVTSNPSSGSSTTVPSVCSPGKFCACDADLGLETYITEDFVASDAFVPGLCHRGVQAICLTETNTKCPALASDLTARTDDFQKALNCPVCIPLPCVAGVDVHDGGLNSIECKADEMNPKTDDNGYAGSDKDCCSTSCDSNQLYICSANDPAAGSDLGFSAATSNCEEKNGCSDECERTDSEGKVICTNDETDISAGVLEVEYRTNMAIVPAKLVECQQQVSDLKDLCTVDGAEDLYDEIKAGPCRTRDTVQNVVTTLKTFIDELVTGIEVTSDLIDEYEGSTNIDDVKVTSVLIQLNTKLAEIADKGSTDTFRKNLKNSVAMVDRIITDTADENEQGTVTQYQGIESIGAGTADWKFKDECPDIVVRYRELGYSGDCAYQPKYHLPEEREALIDPFYQKVLQYLTSQPEGSGPMSFARDSRCIIDGTITSDKPIGRCEMGDTEEKTIKDQQFDDWGTKHDSALSKLNAVDSATTPIQDDTLLYEIHQSCMSYTTTGGQTITPETDDDTDTDTDTDADTDTDTDTDTDSNTDTDDTTGIGQGCNRNSDCPSGNCINDICCANSRYCCFVDSHCLSFGSDAKCDPNTSYCLKTAGGTACPSDPKEDDGGDCDYDDECKSANCRSNICCKRHEQCCTGPDQCSTSSGQMCGGDNYCIEDPNYVQPNSKDNGESCTYPNHCISGNCKSGICCTNRAECCSSNSDCLQNEVCDTSLHYCVTPEEIPPEEDPSSANFCAAFCRETCNIGAINGRCHSELGYCVCNIGFEWKGTSQKCDAPEISPDVKSKMMACCNSLFGIEPDTLDLPNPFEDTSTTECSSAAVFKDGKVHFDKCRTKYSDLNNYCCYQGLEEKPLTKKCYYQDEYATCQKACQDLYPSNEKACEAACKEANVDCEKGCIEAPITQDSTTLLKCMNGEIPGLGDCGANDKVYRQIIGCFQRSPSTYSIAENIKCAQAKKGMLPSFTVSGLGLYKDDVAQTTVYGGDIATVKADITNAGALYFSGQVSFGVIVLPPCPETGCDWSDYIEYNTLGTVQGNNEINLIPAATITLESEPFDVDASWIGNEVWLVLNLRDGSGVVGAYESKTGVSVLKMGVIAPTDAFFNEERIITAYPFQEVTGHVKLVSEYFPLKADVYLTDTNNREIEGTRVSHTYAAKITDPVIVKTNTFTVPKEFAYFGNILRIGFEAFDKNDQLVAKSVLSTPVICDTCPEDYINVLMEYPDAYLKIENPELKVAGANFIDADGEHIPATGLYQKRDVRAQVTVRNAVGVAFDGTVKVTVQDESGTAITAATADLKDKALAKDGKYTITTDAFLAEEGHSYNILVHAVADDVDWFKRQLSRITYPYAVLDVQDLSTVQGEGPKDYTITYALGTCVLRVECTGCLPTCEILVDQPTCTFRSEGVCDPPGSTCSCIAAAV
ncbi:MAG: C-type lectin domain-containing protein [Candidatus Undinarchaeales archaeon]|nr:C-type lectin domain-containing protein [Candidatus Undinarchaeales archaeon]